MAKVIPMCFDASGLTDMQIQREIRRLKWVYGRFNIREYQQNKRVIVIRVRHAA